MADKTLKIWLMGGFGNQLFQINTGAYLIHQGHTVTFVTNLIEKGFVTEKILKWKIHEDTLRSKLLNLRSARHPHLLPALLAKAPMLTSVACFYHSAIDENSLSRHIFGYFQDPEFNADLWFDVDYGFITPITLPPHDTVVHLRFTDANNFSDNLDYYSEAISKLGKAKLFVCTDDREYASNFLRRNSVTDFIISHGSLVDDFGAMVQAKDLVVAPSSFSWWAAKLNKSLASYCISEATAAQFGLPKAPQECEVTVV